MQIKLRPAVREDMAAVHCLVKELALFEKAPDEVITSVETFERDGFGNQPHFFVNIAEDENKNIHGMCLFYFAYSTWKGRLVYLDDIVVTESSRGLGIGRLLLQSVIDFAKESKVAQIRFQVLEWNEPAIGFYQKMGFTLDPEWINCRMNFDIKS